MAPYAIPKNKRKGGEERITTEIPAAETAITQTAVNIFEEVPELFTCIDKEFERRKRQTIESSSGAIVTYPHPDLFFVGETKLQDALYWNPIKKRIPPLSQLVAPYEEDEFSDDDDSISIMTITSAKLTRNRKNTNSLAGLVQQSRASRAQSSLMRSYCRTEKGLIIPHQQESDYSLINREKKKEIESSERSRTRSSLINRSLQNQETADPSSPQSRRRKSRGDNYRRSSTKQEPRGSECSLQLDDIFHTHHDFREKSRNSGNRQVRRHVKRVDSREHHYQKSEDIHFDKDYYSNLGTSMSHLHRQPASERGSKLDQDDAYSVRTGGSMINALNNSKQNVALRSPFRRKSSMESKGGIESCNASLCSFLEQHPRLNNSSSRLMPKKDSLDSLSSPEPSFENTATRQTTNFGGMIAMQKNLSKNASFRPSRNSIRRLSMGAQSALDEYSMDESYRTIGENSSMNLDGSLHYPQNNSAARRGGAGNPTAAALTQYDDDSHYYGNDSLTAVSRRSSASRSYLSREPQQLSRYSTHHKSSIPGDASFTSNAKEPNPFGKSYTSNESFSRLSRSMSRERLPDPKKNEINFRRTALMLRRRDSTRSILDSSESLDRIQTVSRDLRVSTYSKNSSNRNAVWANPTTTCDANPQDRNSVQRSSSKLYDLSGRDLSSTTQNAEDTNSSLSGGSVDDSLDYYITRIASAEVNERQTRYDSIESNDVVSSVLTEDSEPCYEIQVGPMRRLSSSCHLSAVLNTLDEYSESSEEDQSEADNAEKAAVVSTSGSNLQSEVDTLDTQLQQISDYNTLKKNESSLFVDDSQDEQSEPETQAQNLKGIVDSPKKTEATNGGNLSGSNMQQQTVASEEIYKKAIEVPIESETIISDDYEEEVYDWNNTLSLPSNDTTCSESLSVESDVEGFSLTKQPSIFRYHDRILDTKSSASRRTKKSKKPNQTVYNVTIGSLSVCETTGCNDDFCQNCYKPPVPGTPGKNCEPRREDTDEDNISSFAPPLRLLRSMSFKSSTSTRSKASTKSRTSTILKVSVKVEEGKKKWQPNRSKLSIWLIRIFTFGRFSNKNKPSKNQEEAKAKRPFFRRITSR